MKQSQLLCLFVATALIASGWLVWEWSVKPSFDNTPLFPLQEDSGDAVSGWGIDYRSYEDDQTLR